MTNRRGEQRFLARATHDLRQPLQVIVSLLDMLEKAVKEERTLQLVGRLDQAVTAMSKLVDQLRDISELRAIVVPEIIDFPIDSVLNRLRAEFKSHATTKGIRWHVMPCGLTVRSDLRLLEQIIRNLISHSMKYTQMGKMLLGCRRHHSMLFIELWDAGGIPYEELSVIFGAFHQLNDSARVRSEGLGLDLAIVKWLAGLLDHAIDVRSRPGAGSTFTVQVPLAPDAWAFQPVHGQRARSVAKADAESRPLRARAESQ